MKLSLTRLRTVGQLNNPVPTALRIRTEHEATVFEPPTIYLNHYAPRSPTTPQRRLLSCPQPLSPAFTPDTKSLCPSPTPMFHQLYHAVAYWEKQLIGKSATPSHSSSPNDILDHSNFTKSGNSSPSVSRICHLEPPRRMTVPSVRVVEYETTRRQVVTLDPVYTSHTDLDDISQPENGVVVDADADAEISPSDTESELSIKEDDNISETPYVARENEFLGSVRKTLFSLSLLPSFSVICFFISVFLAGW